METHVPIALFVVLTMLAIWVVLPRESLPGKPSRRA